ncbi:MAG: MFS transporter, partial [Buttiauxella noackiae]|nr:MFS transporter [Buttiauxella noackiae]
ALNPAARSRLNAIMFTVVFIGMAAGATLGSKALETFGWTGMVGLATIAALCGLLIRLMGRSTR